jgi:hypothetical protein
LIPLLAYHPKLVSHLLYLYSHLSIFPSEFNILTLQPFLLKCISPHALLHLLIVLLHHMHLLSELTELHLECLDVVLPLCQLLREMLILASELFDLIRRAHIQLGHFLLQELYLVVLLLQLVLQQPLLVLVKTLRGVRLLHAHGRGCRGD